MDEQEEKIVYKSRIADMDEHTIAMEIPIEESTGKFKKLFAGDSLSVFFITEGGVKHYFTSEVTGFREDTVRLVNIQRPTPEMISRIQRRNFLRVSVQLEVAVKTDTDHFTALTEDISGGGFAFMCENKHALHENQVLSCWLLLHFRSGQIEHIPLKASVVRMKKISDQKQLIMTKIEEITASDQQKIIRFCFERQLDFRKN